MYEQSAITVKICELLQGANGVVSYDTIVRAAGVKDFGAARPGLNSARRYLERESGIVFEVIRGKGLRLLDDRERVQSTHGIRRKIFRQSKAGLQRLQTVQDYTALPASDRLTADLNRTLFAMTQVASKPDAAGERKAAGPALPDMASLKIIDGEMQS
jgi:hypothetical protein